MNPQGGYRHAVLDNERAAQLEQLTHRLELATHPAIELGGQIYKRVPAGCPVDHPRADWLRHSGLVASTTQALPPEVFSSDLPSVGFQHIQRFSELQRWLVNLLPD
jgi:hypothetical protein